MAHPFGGGGVGRVVCLERGRVDNPYKAQVTLLLLRAVIFFGLWGLFFLVYPTLISLIGAYACAYSMILPRPPYDVAGDVNI